MSGDLLLELTESRREYLRDREHQVESRERMREAMRAVVAAGGKQTDIARLLGWSRQAVNEFIAEPDT